MEVRIDGLEELLRRVVREEVARDRDGWLDAGAGGTPDGRYPSLRWVFDCKAITGRL